MIALHNKAWNRYLSLADFTLYPSPPENENGILDWWTHQRFTVVDAGNGQIALHNTINNRFVGTGQGGRTHTAGEVGFSIPHPLTHPPTHPPTHPHTHTHPPRTHARTHARTHTPTTQTPLECPFPVMLLMLLKSALIKNTYATYEIQDFLQVA